MNKRKIKLYLFGDSICFGQMVNSYQTWATILSQKIEALNSEEKLFIVQNAGVNGNTTRQALERIYYDVTSHSPDYVLVQFGMNDCNYWATDYGMPRVSQKAFIANLEEIVQKTLLAGAQHCFLNTNHLSLKGDFKHLNDKSYDKSNTEYSELIRTAFSNMVVKGFPISLLDIEKSWEEHLATNKSASLSSFLLEDGIHLSSSGHLLYADIISQKILDVLSSE